MKKIFTAVLCLVLGLMCISCAGFGQETVVETEAAENENLALPVYFDACWTENGAFFAKYEVPIENNGESNIENWSLNVCFSENIRLVKDCWNGWASSKGGVITVTPRDYNKVIRSGESCVVGFIIKFDKQPEILASALYQNGVKLSSDKETVLEQTSVQAAKTATQGAEDADGQTPFEKYGKLSVEGASLVNCDGKQVVLQGVSTHGIAWFPQYVNKEAFRSLRDDFNADIVRLALYSSEGEGFSTELYSKVEEGVKYASELGMYVIIDWHILNNGNPNTDKEKAKEFFAKMAAEFCEYENVFYEICNEPNGDVTWERDIKPYAEELIGLIREYDKDGIIIVGTPTWSQDVDIACQSPLEGVENVMYTFHFYAATHKESYRQKVQEAYDLGLPIFVSEFGACDSSGNGDLDESEADKWLEFLREKGISYVCWNLSNKDESAALIASSCDKTGGWSDDELSPQGKWLKKTYNSKDKDF